MDHTDNEEVIHSQGNSVSRNSSTDEVSSNGTKKAAVKHLYSVKEREKDVHHEPEDFEANLKTLQQQVATQNDADKDIVKQLHVLQQAYDSHVIKWNLTEKELITVRNQKSDLESQVKNLTANLLEAKNEIKSSHQRIENLEHQLKNSSQVVTQTPPQVIYVTQPSSTTNETPLPDFTTNFQEITNVLGSISSQLEAQFSNIHRLLEDNNLSVSKLQTFHNETHNSLSQIQQAQSSLQTAVASLSTIVSTPPSSTATSKATIENESEDSEEPQQIAPTSAPTPTTVVSQVTDSQLLETMRTELESFKKELFALLQQQQQQVVPQPSSSPVPASSTTEASSNENSAPKEATEEPATAPVVVKKEPVPVKTPTAAKTSTTTASKTAVKSTTATATKSTTTAAKTASKTSTLTSKPAVTKKV